MRREETLIFFCLGIQDSKTVVKYEIRHNLRSFKLMVNFTICLENIILWTLSEVCFTGRNVGLISYKKATLDDQFWLCCRDAAHLIIAFFGDFSWQMFFMRHFKRKEKNM